MNDTVEIVQLAIVTMIRGANTSCEINGVWLLYCSCSPDESHEGDDKEKKNIDLQNVLELIILF